MTNDVSRQQALEIINRIQGKFNFCPPSCEHDFQTLRTFIQQPKVTAPVDVEKLRAELFDIIYPTIETAPADKTTKAVNLIVERIVGNCQLLVRAESENIDLNAFKEYMAKDFKFFDSQTIDFVLLNLNCWLREQGYIQDALEPPKEQL